jgi:hypothetical protein
MSNRDIQPLRFNCKECGAPIDIEFREDETAIVGATEVAGGGGLFDPDTNFVDLHLDFPVSFEKYVMGLTPYMRAVQRIGFAEMQLHNIRLNKLNEAYKRFPAFELILKLYARNKIKQFAQKLMSEYGLELASLNPQDINSSLYTLISSVMVPFAFPGQNLESVTLFTDTEYALAQEHRAALDQFVDEIHDTKFLRNLQLNCLAIYPQILAAELPLRPALFLDFDHGYHANKIPMRVSVESFESFKDLFKDISEIIARQFVLIAGLNNLLKRGNHNSFKPGIGLRKSGQDHTPKNLSEYADVDFGKKQAFIDDPWYQIIDGSVSSRLRNAIAHNKVTYDEITQTVTYYPGKEGITQNKSENVSFLEFMRWLLLAYREMHRLHHLVKSLFYSRYLIQKKDQIELP